MSCLMCEHMKNGRCVWSGVCTIKMAGNAVKGGAIERRKEVREFEGTEKRRVQVLRVSDSLYRGSARLHLVHEI